MNKINPYRGPIYGKPKIGNISNIDGMLFENGIRIDGVEISSLHHASPGGGL